MKEIEKTLLDQEVCRATESQAGENSVTRQMCGRGGLV